MAQPRLPYCGAPPTPEMIVSRWNLDPVVILVMLVILALYWCSALARGQPRWRGFAFYAGWGLTLAALISPLCPLSVALFSARVGQHMLLTTAAAPLVVLGKPWETIVPVLRAYPRTLPRARNDVSPTALWAAATFTVVLWAWHAPGPYAATFASDALYWLMHLSLFGSAFWLWSTLLDGGDEVFASRVGGLAITALQMALLGALVTFAPRPLYDFHGTTTWAWGLSPLEDQQLGGAIMWAPSGILFVAGLAGAFLAMMRRAEARSRRLVA